VLPCAIAFANLKYSSEQNYWAKAIFLSFWTSL
jgi:hypothetical protein